MVGHGPLDSPCVPIYFSEWENCLLEYTYGFGETFIHELTLLIRNTKRETVTWKEDQSTSVRITRLLLTLTISPLQVSFSCKSKTEGVNQKL